LSRGSPKASSPRLNALKLFACPVKGLHEDYRRANINALMVRRDAIIMSIIIIIIRPVRSVLPTLGLALA